MRGFIFILFLKAQARNFI